MTKDEDILGFAQKVGAEEPEEGTEFYKRFRLTFPRSNYFILNGKMLIVKISRSARPFWGVGEKYLDFLDSLDYLLVLLTSNRGGWIFSKEEVRANIAGDKWRLREKDREYKINMPLPDHNSFFSPEHFLKRVERYDT